MKDNQFEFRATSELNYAYNPSFLNSVPILLKSLYAYNKLSMNYTYKAWLQFGGWQSIQSNSTRQTSSSRFNYTNYSTTANAAVNWPKSVYWSSNIAFNRSVSSYSAPINYAIWNANLVYRFLKGSNAEIKLSALDLLHQNTSIINTGSSNSVTRGTVNVLQQYFMFSMAYYPRKFGNTSKK